MPARWALAQVTRCFRDASASAVPASSEADAAPSLSQGPLLFWRHALHAHAGALAPWVPDFCSFAEALLADTDASASAGGATGTPVALSRGRLGMLDGGTVSGGEEAWSAAAAAGAALYVALFEAYTACHDAERTSAVMGSLVALAAGGSALAVRTVGWLCEHETAAIAPYEVSSG